MASIDTKARSNVRHPLSALRGYIRSYVTLEGVAFLLMFVFVWFWVGLLIDYVVLHKLLGVDYVRWLPFSGVAGKIFRIGVLGGLLAWLVTKLVFMVFVRLFRDFSDGSLALLLERRYPDELGDRLITAVELSDPQKAALQGYSADMVAETIHEAGERVKQLPVRGVFDWGRLLVQGLVVVALTGVAYVLAVGLFHVARPYQANRVGLSGFGGFHDVAFIWAERNLLLQDTPWPGDVILVQLTPEKDTVRVGSNQGKLPIKYRAIKYVLADATVEEGWRPLLVKDLQERGHLVDGAIPTPPADWKGKYNAAGDLSLDEAELLYARLPLKGQSGTWTVREVREQGAVERPLLWSELASNANFGVKVPALTAEWDPAATPIHFAGAFGLLVGGQTSHGLAAEMTLLAGPVTTSGLTVDDVGRKLAVLNDAKERPELVRDLNSVFDRLTRIEEMRALLERAPAQLARADLSRLVRVLDLPNQVDLVSTIRNQETRVTMSRSRETNEFSDLINLPDISSTIYYQARAAGFSTPVRIIEVIGPPQLLELYSDELQPAYLFYRWQEDVPVDRVAGLKQLITGRDRLNPGGTLSTVDVPAGTDLTLRVTAERLLSSARAVPQDAEGKLPPGLAISEVNEDTRVVEGSRKAVGTFTITIPNLQADARFAIELIDRDGVKGSRTVFVRVQADAPADPPDVRPNEVLRKIKGDTYLVTPKARLPFAGLVKDKFGLATVRYAYTVEQIDLIPKLNPAALSLYLSAFATGGVRGQGFGTAVPLYLEALGRHRADEATRLASIKTTRSEVLPGFLRAIGDKKEEPNGRLSLEELEALTAKALPAPPRSLVNTYSLVPDFSLDKPGGYKWDSGRGAQINDFFVEQARYQDKPLQVQGGNDLLQPRYKVEVWLEARDTNLGSLGAVSRSKENFTFLIVPEYEMLLEINKSEEALNFRLIQLSRESGKSWEGDSLTKMESDLSTDLIQLAGSNVKTPEIRQMAARIKTMKELLQKGQTYVRDVLNEYRSLVLEMEINRIDEQKLLEKRRDVVKPLEKVLAEAFPRAQASMDRFEIALNSAGLGDVTNTTALTSARQNGATAQNDLRQLHGDLEGVIQALEQVANEAKLVEILKKQERELAIQAETLIRRKKEIEDELFKIPPK